MGRPASRSGAEARALEGAGEVSGAMARPEVKIGLPSHASDACGVCFLLLHTSHARHHDITAGFFCTLHGPGYQYSTHTQNG